MEIAEAIRQRKSIRAFKPDPVPQEVLRELLELALRAPSFANTQPWEFAVVTGADLERIRRAYVDNAEAGIEGVADIPYPGGFPELYDARRRTVGKKVFELKGIGREDREKRKWWLMQGLRLFGAPCVIYVLTDRSFCLPAGGANPWPVFDCGLLAAHIMLLAPGYGLGTIAQIQAVAYPGVLRETLGIPDSKLILLGIAIGYPDPNDPINGLCSERDPLDQVSTWHGWH
ncbi:MAG: nitroreductase [Dehalococcoidia bacterium]